MSGHWTVCLGSLLALASAAMHTDCSPESPAHGVSVRDSSGVEIVENTASGSKEVEATWRASEEPALVIGSVRSPPEQVLHRVTDAALLSDGTIVVANSGSGQLRFYDGEANHLRDAGDQGAGPAEFAHITAIEATSEDSIFVFDARRSRLSVFGPGGAFARSVTLGAGGAPGLAGIVPVGWLDDAALLTERSSVVERENPASEGLFSYQTELKFAVYDRRGDLLHEVVNLPGHRRAALFSEGGPGDFSIRSVPVPFQRRVLTAVVDRMLVVGATDSRSLRLYELDGSLRRIVRDEAMAPRPVTDEVVDSWISVQLGDEAGRRERRQLRKRIAQMRLPDHLPNLDALRVDRRDRIWVREYRPPSDEKRPSADRWIVYDREGHRLGIAELPHGLQPYEIGDDYVLGLWEAELNVEQIRLYGLNDATKM